MLTCLCVWDVQPPLGSLSFWLLFILHSQLKCYHLRIFKRLKIEWPHDPAILEMKLVCWGDICTPMFVAALFLIAKIRKQPENPSSSDE
jgi:hypothetical protein